MPPSLIGSVLLVMSCFGSFTYLLSLFSCPSVGLLESHVEGVLHVVASGTPFEVVRSVVVLVAIFVVYFLHVVRARQEGLRHQSVNTSACRFVVDMKHDVVVAAALYGLWHDARVALHLAHHTSEVAHLVLAISSLNRFPNFFHSLTFALRTCRMPCVPCRWQGGRCSCR